MLTKHNSFRLLDWFLLKLRDAQLQLELRDEKIRELKMQLDMARDTEARQSTEIQILRRQLGDVEAAGGGYSGMTSRLENKESYDRIRDLENRLRSSTFWKHATF